MLIADLFLIQALCDLRLVKFAIVRLYLARKLKTIRSDRYKAHIIESTNKHFVTVRISIDETIKVGIIYSYTIVLKIFIL